MKDNSWINRLVEFRGPLTLGQHLGRRDNYADIFLGKIKNVYRKDGELRAEAEAIYVKSISIAHYRTNPDPNWTAEQYNRRRHHRDIVYVRRQSRKTFMVKAEKQIVTIRYSQRRWKPVKI